MRRSEAASSVSSPPRPLRPGWVPVTDLDDSPLSAEEIAYGQASRASPTIEVHRTDWQEFCDWCASEHHDPAPAQPAAVSGYLMRRPRRGCRGARITGVRETLKPDSSYIRRPSSVASNSARPASTV